MDSDVVISIENVSKKFCRSLRKSMYYGLADVGRNIVGIKARSGELRPYEFWALDDIDLQIKRGESIGLLGRNGSGKTTLLKMIDGIFWPDKGKLSVRGRVGALISVGAGFHPLLTGRENVYVNAAIMGMTRDEVDERFDDIAAFAEVDDFLDTPVKNYSSGMYVRLGFAVAVHAEPEIMLVDEVLAVGDRGFQAKCFKRMAALREKGTTFVVVSHNMHTVAGFVDRVALLENGKMELYNTFEGVKRYESLFQKDQTTDIERLVNGGRDVDFTDVKLSERELSPGDSFTMELQYTAKREYEDIEVDLVIYDARDPEVHFQANNRAFKQRIDLHPGSHTLSIRIDELRINGSPATVTMAIWTSGRTEHLFWWRIPLSMKKVAGTHGRTFLPVQFETRSTP